LQPCSFASMPGDFFTFFWSIGGSSLQWPQN